MGLHPNPFPSPSPNPSPSPSPNPNQVAALAPALTLTLPSPSPSPSPLPSQFVAIQRGDTGEWALPGGMVDAGEAVKATLKREFMEEASNLPKAQKAEFKAELNALFAAGAQVCPAWPVAR